MRTVIKSIRPEIEASIEQANTLEIFQNQTLRPILKFQNELLMQLMKHYFMKRKDAFYELKNKEKPKYIDHAIRQDLRFKSQMLGVIIGHFTHDEFDLYTQHEAELSRRMTDLLCQRIVSQVEVFVK